MRIPFVKMHGLGNDFVVLDRRDAPPPPLTAHSARRISDRHQGIGCDQLVVLEPAQTGDGDLRMRIFNADGGEVGACGNAARAVALLLGTPARVETGGGIITVSPHDGGAAIDMGVPNFGWDAVPLAYAMDTLAMPVSWDALENPVAVNVGNPHVVFFVHDADAVPLAELGPRIETDPLFPERVNVNVATIESRSRLRLRVWERGAGLTRACGTGACASAVAAIRRGLADRRVTVALPGGELEIAWGSDGRIAMTGPAAESFRGSFDWADYA
jgi:diaminopimelate epimerase